MCAQANNTTPPPLYEDFISSFENGCNSGILPLLLQKNQIGFGLNTSVRGAYITHRPPIQKKNLTFQNGTVEKNYQSGFFQGGGYYRPDFGTESLICQISGRLFQMIETNGIWNVTDISVPGDPNSPIPPQVWMWQSEKWMIIQDGTGKLPIFFDGATSRRSYGPSSLLAVVSATAPAAPPAINGIVTATLTAPYTGPYNVPVIFNKAYYQPIPNVNGNQVVLTNINDIPGNTVSKGSNVIVNPSIVGIVTANTFSGQNGPATGYIFMNIPISNTTALQDGQGYPAFSLNGQFSISNVSWTPYGGQFNCLSNSGNLIFECISKGVDSVYAQSLTAVTDSGGCTGNGIFIPQGAIVSIQTSSPNFIVGVTNADFVVPAVGATVTAYLNAPYSGPSGQVVIIGGNQYEITNPAGSPSGLTLYLQNLTDVSTVNYIFNQNIMSVPEITAGRMGAYGMGRNWWSLTDGISFEAGDIVGGAAGSQANNYRDAVLKTTENDFLSGGGSFRLPGTGDVITSMVFTANLDQSLGQGALQVGTDTTMFSCNTPVDRTTWSTLTNPILTESLIGTGPLGQNSTELVNSDVFFRTVAGLGDLVLARRDFGGWGNHPISNEMTRTIQLDNQTLLQYGSSVNFDNRFITTCAPNVSAQGVFHIGLIAMNLDTISNLRTQLPPVYDGLWTGVNALQIISGKVNGSVRSFAWVFNLTANIIELWEFLPEKTDVTQDNGVTPITWTFETPVMFNKDVKKITEFIKLTNGELYLSEIVGTVSVQVQYRPDHYPCWVNWHSFQVCANPDTTVPNSQPGYRAPIGLGEPDSSVCEPGNNRPLRTGFYFQFRLVITGSCKFMGMRVEACPESRPKFAPPICDGVCNV